MVSAHLKPTPLLHSAFLSEYFEADVWLKCEQFQPIGAFKIRGATYFASQVKDDLSAGFVTHSSGNHAQAVAYTAHRLGIPARVVMPSNSNQRKVALAKRWGAEVIACEPNLAARESTANEVLKEHGGTLMPPYDHPWIIGGQATAMMEVLRQRTDIDMVITPLGGGGLLAGTIAARNHFATDVKVIGAEPENAADGWHGWKSGTRVESHQVSTIADGLRTTVGVVPFDIIQSGVDDIWLAPEAAIEPWTTRCWQECKLLIELSSAVPLVAMEQNREAVKGKRVVVVLTGGNVEFENKA